MNDIEKIGYDASQAPAIQDWKAFYSDFLVPTYHHQPLVCRQIATVKPTPFDGKNHAEAYTDDDIDDPLYAMEDKQNDTALAGDSVPIKLPRLNLSTLLTDDDMKRPFAQRDRLKRWVVKATRKFAQWEDIVAFRGDTGLGITGFISADSYDLGSPTGVWDVDTSSDGVLENAAADFQKAIDYFMANGLGERPITAVVTSYIMSLLRKTKRIYSKENNVEYLLSIMPPGSRIMYSNNIQASVTANANSACFFVQLMSDGDGLSEEGAYELYGSGIEQSVHHVDNWKWRYALREKWSVKVLNNAYVCWMDAIDTVT